MIKKKKHTYYRLQYVKTGFPLNIQAVKRYMFLRKAFNYPHKATTQKQSLPWRRDICQLSSNWAITQQQWSVSWSEWNPNMTGRSWACYIGVPHGGKMMSGFGKGHRKVMLLCHSLKCFLWRLLMSRLSCRRPTLVAAFAFSFYCGSASATVMLLL